MDFASLTTSNNDRSVAVRSGGDNPRRSPGASGLRWLGVVVALAALSGCVASENSVFKHSADPNKGVCRLAATWSGLAITTDTANAGKPLPCLLGHLYLIDGDRGLPVLAPGTVDVELYDASKPPDGRPAECLERWKLDPKTLARLSKKGEIGQGYILLLPWGTYHPNISKVQLRVAFTPLTGNPIYSEPSLVTIRQPMARPIEERQVLATPKK